MFQFPPLGRELVAQPGYFAEHLGEFLAALPAGPRYTVELRDCDLLSADYCDALKAVGAQHCLNVHPRMPSVKEQRHLAHGLSDGPLVVRWMLRNGLG